MIDRKTFEEDGFIIDSSNAKDAAQVVQELTTLLELPDTKGKKICLKLGEVELTQSQLLSIKSLIGTMGACLEIVDSESEKTKLAATDLEITVEKFSNEIEVEELASSEIEIKEIEVGEPKDGLSYELLENPMNVSEETSKILDDVFQKTLESKDEISEVKVAPKELSEEEIAAKEELEQKKQEEVMALDEISKLPTYYLQQNLRSGQTMSYDGNVVLIGDAKPGSEIIAKGDITVWGVLGGIAHAGARGNEYAKIRALKIHAIQLRISGFYARRPDSINIPFIQKTDTFMPEEARVNNGEIAIFKMSE